MSGGYFNYDQYQIGGIAEKIQKLIEARKYAPVVIGEFENAINYLQVAQIYAHRIDWLVSGDDGEKQFLKRLEEDLAKRVEKMMAAAKTSSQGILDNSEEET